MMKNKKFFLLLCGATTLLAACGNTREQFNFSKEAPDEFAIVKRAPLEMPEDSTALPAPKPGMARPQEKTTVEQARNSILGEEAGPRRMANQLSDGEYLLIDKAGATTVPANVRAAVDAETAALAAEQTPTVDRIMKITGKKIDAPAKEVDAVAETNRIKANIAAGRPANEGETAVKED